MQCFSLSLCTSSILFISLTPAPYSRIKNAQLGVKNAMKFATNWCCAMFCFVFWNNLFNGGPKGGITGRGLHHQEAFRHSSWYSLVMMGIAGFIQVFLLMFTFYFIYSLVLREPIDDFIALVKNLLFVDEMLEKKIRIISFQVL